MTHDGQIEPWERLIAGSLAGIASQSSIYPMEVSYLEAVSQAFKQRWFRGVSGFIFLIFR